MGFANVRFYKRLFGLLEVFFNAIKLSNFGAATSVADMRLKSHPQAYIFTLS